MKKVSLLILITTLIIGVGSGLVYAAALTAASNTAVGGDGAITAIEAGSFARQTASLNFTASNDVNLEVFVSTSRENYTASAGHTNGDKSYALASSGGGVYYQTKAAGTAHSADAPTIDDAGAVTWTGWTAM